MPEIKEYTKVIDVEKVIESKNPLLKKSMPGFLLKYLKRILHEEDINYAINKCKDHYGLDFVNNILDMFDVNLHVKGGHNIPKTGAKIIAANHPMGGLEGLGLMSATGDYRKDIKFIVNDILLNIDNLKELFIPVNKVGATSKESIRIMNETYSSDLLVLTFPFGLVSRKRNGKIMDLEWKKSFIGKAKQYSRDVVPVHIDGRNSNFFYNLSNFRKFFGIKANIEMLYLINEMYKQKNKTINFTFGNPISYKVFDNRCNDKEWAERVRKHVYELAANENAEFKY